MTPTLAETPFHGRKSAEVRQVNIEEIVDSLRSAGEDIEQIGKLILKEQRLAQQLLAALKCMQPLGSSIAVSTAVLPAGMREVTEAYVDYSGFLSLTFMDGRQELRDLSEDRNLDLLLTVASDIAPKFESLVAEAIDKFAGPPAIEEPQEPPQIQAPQVQETPPAPETPVFKPPPVIEENAPVALKEPEPAPAHVQEEPHEEPVEEPSEPAPASPPLPSSPAAEGAKLVEVTEETLGYLKELGTEVFEHSPVSMYFDDWMVNLRQVILSFESSEAIGADEEFTNERDKIFSNIEDELANRLMTEAELEASAKTLAENKHFLREIDAGYAAETRELIVRGKSALDFLIKNVNHLEKELSEIEQVKTSYLHPLKRMAKEQRRTELTEKLNAAKKRLALAVASSAVDQVSHEGVDAEIASQTSDLAAKRNRAMRFFTGEVDDLKEEAAKLEKNKAVTFNPVKRVALEQKIWETTQKLNAAKKRLELAEQNSAAQQQEKIYDEYEKKKQATVEKLGSLEKEIAINERDGSLEVRQAATEALANAVKSLVQRKTAPTQPAPTESTK